MSDLCAGCEGKPAPENNPCAVCGTTTEPMPIAEVSAEDREAAAPILRLYGASNYAAICEGGLPYCDKLALVQAFARHRLTALADAERKLEEATSILRAWDDWYCGRERELTPADETVTFLAAQDGGKG